jgi:hypothetical protein
MNEPKILYHYTTAIGLMGIVQSQTLWAPNAEFLNDARELRFGRPQVLDAPLKEADELSPDSGAFDANTSRATVMRSAADHLAPGGLFARRQSLCLRFLEPRPVVAPPRRRRRGAPCEVAEDGRAGVGPGDASSVTMCGPSLSVETGAKWMSGTRAKSSSQEASRASAPRSSGQPGRRVRGSVA